VSLAPKYLSEILTDMPPAAKKRKTRASAKEAVVEDVETQAPETTEPSQLSEPTEQHNAPAPAEQLKSELQEDVSTSTSAADDAAAKAKERMERFKALQARAKSSAKQNLHETKAEASRLATDPTLLSSLNRKHAIASHKLLKADTLAAGEDFERKRAWDWTIEESEKWDKRLAKKAAHKDDAAFQDYRQDSRKVYKRQVGNIQVDSERYQREKMKAIERAAASGGLEIVETDDGELVAVDKNGTFFSSADDASVVENKPDKAAVDRLVADLQKAEEVRLKKRRERGLEKEDGDVTYINEKNKQFNQKLARFYNKVCAHPLMTTSGIC
jgi:pre-mRNA-splicing factor SYF2